MQVTISINVAFQDNADILGGLAVCGWIVGSGVAGAGVSGGGFSPVVGTVLPLSQVLDDI